MNRKKLNQYNECVIQNLLYKKYYYKKKEVDNYVR